MKKYTVTLSLEERNQLNELTSKGKYQSQMILNALILLGCEWASFKQVVQPMRKWLEF